MAWIYRGTFNMMFCQIFRSFTCFNNIPHKAPKDKAKEAEKPEKQDAATKKARNGMKRLAVGSWMPTFGNIPGFLEYPR